MFSSFECNRGVCCGGSGVVFGQYEPLRTF